MPKHSWYFQLGIETREADFLLHRAPRKMKLYFWKYDLVLCKTVEDANFSTILQAFIKCRLIRKISRQLNLPSLIGYFFHLLVHWLVPKLYLINWVHVGIKRTMIGKLLVLSLPDLGSFTCALCSTSFARKHAARRIYTALLQRIFYATWSRSNPSLLKELLVWNYLTSASPRWRKRAMEETRQAYSQECRQPEMRQ